MQNNGAVAETERQEPEGRIARMLPWFVLAVTALLALRKLDDFDTWWHLASGRWIVTNGRVPHFDTLSFTVPDHAWVNLQWAYDVVLYGLHHVGGVGALVIAAAASFTLAVWLLMRNVRRSLGPLASSLLVAWAVLVAEERFLIRPEMLSFVFLEALIGMTLCAEGAARRRARWAIPALMLAWVNCHALFIVGVVCVGCYLAAAVADALHLLPNGLRPARAVAGEPLKQAVVVSLAAILATVVNPYGLRGSLFPFELWSRINGSNSVFQAIGEFRRPFSSYFPTFSIGAYQALLVFSVLVVGLALVLLLLSRGERRRSRLDVGGVVFFAVMAYLSLLARRNIGLFAFAATPIVAAALATIGERLPRNLKTPARRLAPLAAAAGMLACVALALAVTSNRYYRASEVTHEFGLGVFTSNFPIDAARFAREQQLPGPVYNDLTSGGYLAWSPAAEGGVFIDGRLEVYDTEFFSSYLSALSNPALWKTQADRLGIQTVLLFHRWGNRQQLIRVLRGDPYWDLVYHDATAVIFVRRRGNLKRIAEARRAFTDWHRRTLAQLASPAGGWRWPIDRATALESYGVLMFILGEPDAGLRLYEQLLALGPQARKEASLRFRVGYVLARRGQTNQALLHLRRAAQLDPDNRRVRELLRTIGE